jgi:hypothetical protein
MAGEICIRRNRVLAVLCANAILWAATIVITGSPFVGGAAVLSLISIHSLLFLRSLTS